MEFKLLQYVEKEFVFNKTVLEKNSNKKNVYKNKSSLPEIIKLLNENEILNPSIQGKADVIFEDFSAFTKITNWINQFYNKKEKNAFYNSETRKIHFYESLFNESNNSTKGNEILDKLKDEKILIKQVTIHEIGHAIQHNYINHLKYNGLNSIIQL